MFTSASLDTLRATPTTGTLLVDKFLRQARLNTDIA